MRILPVRASALDSGGRRLVWSPARRWLALQLALGAGIAAVFLRYFRGERLTMPLGKFWGIADDMYISASFARTFAEGQGLVWYPGAPRVEGFSNPLWVLLLAAIHRLPWFRETRLGFYVAVCNTLILMLLGFELVRCARRALGEERAPSLGSGALAALLAMVACTPLCICVSVGFETGAVALFSVAAFAAALAPGDKAPWGVAVLTALAFWTRMDAVITCLPALGAVALRPEVRRRAAGPLALLAGLVALQFVLRRWYYGAYFPNTYYLKASGWSFAARTGQGIVWAAGLVLTTVFLTTPVFLARRRALGRAAAPVALALLAFALTIVYSINNGGDLIYVFGHDRFNAAGGVFLAFALVAGILSLPSSLARRALGGVVGFAIATGPFWYPFPRGALVPLRDFFDLRKPALPQDTPAAMWSYHGRMLRQITKPGARIAVCAAGATVYFSHRGGVDLLGKVEPLVAHMKVPDKPPSEARCWRGFPGAGHNKEDVPGVFQAHTPEVSVVTPPLSHAARYTRIRYRGLQFYALRQSAYVEWQDVEVVD